MVDTKKTKRLHIGMAYTYVGDTGIDIPMELLEGKTDEEQLEIACKYAQEHIDEIPVATNAEYIPYSTILRLVILILKITNSNTEKRRIKL